MTTSYNLSELFYFMLSQKYLFQTLKLCFLGHLLSLFYLHKCLQSCISEKGRGCEMKFRGHVNVLQS